MRKNIVAIAVLFLSAIGVQAQIDRSQMPEPGPAPKINLEEPESFTLKNGLRVMVVEDSKLPRVNMILTMDNPPYAQGDKAGVSQLTSGLLGKGSTNISKDEFNEEVDFLGARLNFSSNGASANTLSKFFPRVMELMAEGALNPNFVQEEFDPEKERLITGLKSTEKDVASNARQIRSALAYGKDHPYGEFATIESVEGVTLQDVKEYYNTFFVPANAYLVVIGDVNTKEVKKLAKKNFGKWKKNSLPNHQLPEVKNVAKTQINFVDFPNAVQSEIHVINSIDLTMDNEDYFPTLIANQILGGGGEGRLFLNLREDKGYTYGAYSSTRDDKYAGSFSASASVRNEVTDSATVAFLDELHRIRNEQVSNEELENAKAKYTGNFVMALEQPSTVAQYALNIETEDLPGDFYENYLQRINQVSIQDIQRVAKKYFQTDNTRIVIVGKGSEVADKLENLTYNGEKIPVKYFNKYAEPIEKPEFKKEIDPSITVETVYEMYIEAIGGREAVESIQSVFTTAQANIQGQQLSLEMIITADGKSSNTVSMMGNVMSKQVFDGENGFVVANGQKIPFDQAQAEAAKAEADPFPELSASETAVLEGIETVDDQDAYVIAVSEDMKNYYSVDSGLKIQSVRTITQMGQTITMPTIFSDYREVEGVLFPFSISQSMGPQSFVFEVSEIKINQDVSDEDFQ